MPAEEFWKRSSKNIKNLNTVSRPATAYLINGETILNARNSHQPFKQECLYYKADVRKYLFNKIQSH